MKKKEILKRLEELFEKIDFPESCEDDIGNLISDIKKDMKQYLTPIEAITKLYNGEVKKITNDKDFYYFFDEDEIQCFNANGTFANLDVYINKKDKWWVV